MIDQAYPVSSLIELLNTFYERAIGLEYGQEHEVMHCAAVELQKQESEIKRLRAALEVIASGEEIEAAAVAKQALRNLEK